MYLAGHPYKVMSNGQIELIFWGSLRILEEMGMEIQNETLLRVLAEAGLLVDFAACRVRFPLQFVQDFLGTAEKFAWRNARPRVSASAGVYHSLYHDPYSGELLPWNEERMANYFALARSLPHVNGAHMLGCRLPTAGPLEPLYERYFCWKYGASEGGSIYLDELCPYLLELYEAKAEEQGQTVDDVFRGTVYLVPALKLGRHEAYQVMYFHAHGLRVGIGGSMLTMGATAPVTLAGAVTLNLAEQLALRILEWILWGEKRLSIGVSISAMDMRTAIRPFGRPEMTFANLMTAQIARWLGAAFNGHAGLCDAKLPSVEAGVQKSLSAVATLMVGGNLWLDAGLLGIDEVCSPIQLILDHELIAALERFTHAFKIDAATIGLEAILEAGPGGNYLASEHTARRFRHEIWEPTLWSRQMLQPWLAEGKLLDVDRARQIAMERMSSLPNIPPMSDWLERQIFCIIHQAEKTLAS